MNNMNYDAIVDGRFWWIKKFAPIFIVLVFVAIIFGSLCKHFHGESGVKVIKVVNGTTRIVEIAGCQYLETTSGIGSTSHVQRTYISCE